MKLDMRALALLVAVSWLIAVCVPAITFAQGERIHVLGLRSVEGDDRFARELSGAVRVAAGAVPGWAVSADDVSLSQMTLVYGCDDPNSDCMTSIAEELNADKVIYGTVRRSGSREDFSFGLSLYLFDRRIGSIVDQIADAIPQSEAETDALRARAVRYVAQLGGQTRYGAIRLDVGEVGALVRVDGATIGLTSTSGTILIEDLTVGSHAVRIDANGFKPFETDVEVSADEQSELSVDLSAPGTQGSGRSFAWVPGAALVAGGVIATAFGIRSGARVNRVNGRIDRLGDPQLEVLGCVQDAESAFISSRSTTSFECSGDGGITLTRAEVLVLTTQQGDDACDLEDNADPWRRDTCDSHDRDFRVQLATYLVGGAAIGVGTYLLIRALTDDDDDERSDLDVNIAPWTAGRSGGLDMTLNW